MCWFPPTAIYSSHNSRSATNKREGVTTKKKRGYYRGKRHLVVFAPTSFFFGNFSPLHFCYFHYLSSSVYSKASHRSVVALRSHVVVPLDFAPNGWANWERVEHIRMYKGILSAGARYQRSNSIIGRFQQLLLRPYRLLTSTLLDDVHETGRKRWGTDSWWRKLWELFTLAIHAEGTASYLVGKTARLSTYYLPAHLFFFFRSAPFLFTHDDETVSCVARLP